LDGGRLSAVNSVRSLPRAFVTGATEDAPFDLPGSELEKFRKVLRLGSGDPVAILPGDGRLIVGRLDGRQVVPERTLRPDTEPSQRVWVAQSMPKGDKIEDVLRLGTELGAAGFLLFESERTVLKWDSGKWALKLERFQSLVRESAELAFRTVLPPVQFAPDLPAVLADPRPVIVLAESERVANLLPTQLPEVVLVVGPEGGWSEREMAAIGDRAVTLGPRVLRAEHAGAAALARIILPAAP
jgi:16S rRNA (uracil1498-N3)-methyltransferase